MIQLHQATRSLRVVEGKGDCSHALYLLLLLLQGWHQPLDQSPCLAAAQEQLQPSSI